MQIRTLFAGFLAATLMVGLPTLNQAEAADRPAKTQKTDKKAKKPAKPAAPAAAPAPAATPAPPRHPLPQHRSVLEVPSPELQRPRPPAPWLPVP